MSLNTQASSKQILTQFENSNHRMRLREHKSTLPEGKGFWHFSFKKSGRKGSGAWRGHVRSMEYVGETKKSEDSVSNFALGVARFASSS